ncbi:MAG TPA: DoxX family protein [Mycobacteriales bacterium]|nr:DoxX family protein [Mycobacteriales bacterium]
MSVVSHPENVGLLALRVAVGVVFLAHGYNHIWGGGKIAGTARWFSSLGMEPGILHAWVASLVELGAGALLIVGLLTPFAGGAVIGVMLVAWITNHRKNGFFIFRPGEGYEYVMTLTFCGILFCCTGGGQISLDHAAGIFELGGMRWIDAGLALLAGFGGAAGLLVTCWRPNKVAGKS